jgi:phospholipid/cholesterol/gamma-HCH transport system permease protein
VSAADQRNVGASASPAYARWVALQAGHLSLFLEALVRVAALANPMVRLVFLRQVYQIGVQGMRTIALLAVASGTLLVVEATEILGAGNAYVYELVGWLLVTEAAPLLVAIVIVGRSATVIATELALLQVRGEVRSLERMRIDVVDYLVVPRIAALTVSLLAATLYYEVIAIAGGFGAAALFLQVSYEEQTRLLLEALSAGALVLTAAKTGIFGLLIGTVACYAGLNAGATVEEVPLAQVNAYMRALSYVIVIDVLFALPTF